MDISKAITIARPNSQWSLNGNSLEGLQWGGHGEQPSMSELEEAVARYNESISARKSWPSKATFWSEFTDTEKAHILTSADPRIKVLYSELTMWHGGVWSDDLKIQLGLALLESTGIITPERKTTILAKP